MRFALLVALATAALLTAALPAHAGPPVVFTSHEEFPGVDACTGLAETVTVDSTIFEPVFGVSRSTSTVTTSSGFTGTSESEISVFHEAFTILNDMLYNPATGQRTHAHVVVIDDHVADVSFTCIPVGQT